MLVSPGFESFAGRRRDGTADTDFVSARFFAYVAQAARLLISHRHHLLPPGPHVVLITKMRDDLLMRHLVSAGGIKVLKPARPVLPGFSLDCFVAHARFERFFCHSPLTARRNQQANLFSPGL